MTILVVSVERLSHSLAVARVVAVSRRKVHGRVAARIDVEVTFRADGVATKDIAGRARDAAVEFLDVA
jgi:hypothetical protein